MNNSNLVLASKNPGKIRELEPLLASFGYQIRLLPPDCPEAPETGLTFVDNALQKAAFYAQLTGLPCLAEDSGLVVDALGGAPGVYSARYGEDLEFLPGESKDQRNIRKLVRNLADLPAPYSARFCCAMLLYFAPGQMIKAQGVWEGEISLTPCGDNGFGYDPVFVDPQLGKSAACLSREQKSRYSHRGQALRDLINKLSTARS